MQFTCICIICMYIFICKMLFGSFLNLASLYLASTLESRYARSQTLGGHPDRINCVGYACDGRHVALAFRTKDVSVWKVDARFAKRGVTLQNGQKSKFLPFFSPKKELRHYNIIFEVLRWYTYFRFITSNWNRAHADDWTS